MDTEVTGILGADIASSHSYLSLGRGRLTPTHKRVERRLIGLGLVERRLLLG